MAARGKDRKPEINRQQSRFHKHDKDAATVDLREEDLDHRHRHDGLWLAAAWGAVVWLTAVVSMAVVEVFFPQVYGGSVFVVLVESTLLAIYLWLAIFAARGQSK